MINLGPLDSSLWLLDGEAKADPARLAELAEIEEVEDPERAESLAETLSVFESFFDPESIWNIITALDQNDLDEALAQDAEEGNGKARREWPPRVENLSNVGRLVHLAARMTADDVERLRGEILGVRRRTYEQEITQQARRVGCANARGRLTAGPSLSEMEQQSRADAESIVNTYNYDLAGAIDRIIKDVPTANRHVIAYRLRAWQAGRNQWKLPQIAQWTEGSARAKAFADFYKFNDIQGVAILRPESAAEPICQGWINRGEVPLKVAIANPTPYHVNCPHNWRSIPGKVARSECRELWLG